MDKSSERESVSKIYCEKCDQVFNSRKKYDEHSTRHSSGVYCESCPLDIAIKKIVGLFKRGK